MDTHILLNKRPLKHMKLARCMHNFELCCLSRVKSVVCVHRAESIAVNTIPCHAASFSDVSAAAQGTK